MISKINANYSNTINFGRNKNVDKNTAKKETSFKEADNSSHSVPSEVWQGRAGILAKVNQKSAELGAKMKARAYYLEAIATFKRLYEPERKILKDLMPLGRDTMHNYVSTLNYYNFCTNSKILINTIAEIDPKMIDEGVDVGFYTTLPTGNVKSPKDDMLGMARAVVKEIAQNKNVSPEEKCNWVREAGSRLLDYSYSKPEEFRECALTILDEYRAFASEQ